MKTIPKIIRGIDRTIEVTGAIMMMAMVAIVVYQVFGRYVLQSEPSWSEEVALLLMMWYGFLSISIGFRYKFHLRLTFIVDRFPCIVKKILDVISNILIVLFGLLLIVEGYKFTLLTWSSTLPVTKLPNGVQYMIIPLTGILTMLYGLVWIFDRKGETS